MKKIYLGADHRGYDLKEKVKGWLNDLKVDFQDEGAYEFNKKDDYPLFAQKVAVLVSHENSSGGILLCGSGVGVDVVANKFDKIRSSLGKSAAQVKAGRMDDDMNVLVLASDFTKDTEAKEMVEAFVKTPFSGKSRHKKRLLEVQRIEENN